MRGGPGRREPPQLPQRRRPQKSPKAPGPSPASAPPAASRAASRWASAAWREGAMRLPRRGAAAPSRPPRTDGRQGAAKAAADNARPAGRDGRPLLVLAAGGVARARRGRHGGGGGGRGGRGVAAAEEVERCDVDADLALRVRDEARELAVMPRLAIPFPTRGRVEIEEKRPSHSIRPLVHSYRSRRTADAADDDDTRRRHTTDDDTRRRYTMRMTRR